MTTYDRITELIKANDLSQGRLEKALGLSNGLISKWRNSVPKSDSLQLVADYFGVSTDFLTTGREKKTLDEQVALDVKIVRDVELKKAIEKYYTLDSTKRKLVIDLIMAIAD